ncbi:MAG: hypothetical protein IKO82_07885 [Prevotella sp.]|nr:hypothetical protein [Prevotella sp.]
MCTLSINIDETKVRQINPALTNRESINQWLQLQIDELIEDYSSELAIPPCSYTQDEMETLCEQRMEDLLSGRSTTIPHQEVMSRMSMKYGLSA